MSRSRGRHTHQLRDEGGEGSEQLLGAMAVGQVDQPQQPRPAIDVTTAERLSTPRRD